jgi:hypothetical protein
MITIGDVLNVKDVNLLSIAELAKNVKTVSSVMFKHGS